MKKVSIIIFILVISLSLIYAKAINMEDKKIGSLGIYDTRIETFLKEMLSSDYNFEFTQKYFYEKQRKQYTFLYNDLLSASLPIKTFRYSFKEKQDNIYLYKVRVNNIVLVLAIIDIDSKLYLHSLEKI